MKKPTEKDRLIAIMQGSYLAKHFPNVWRTQQMKPDHKERDELLKELQKKLRIKEDDNNIL